MSGRWGQNLTPSTHGIYYSDLKNRHRTFTPAALCPWCAEHLELCTCDLPDMQRLFIRRGYFAAIDPVRFGLPPNRNPWGHDQ